MATLLADEIDVLAKAKRALPADYQPSDDEPYMGPEQLDYFRRLLLEWKKSILSASADTLQLLQDGPIREPDLNDRASSETDWGIELRTRDRQRKQDRFGAPPDRGRRIRLVRSDRRSDRHWPSDRAPRSNNDGRSAAGARAAREDFAGQLSKPKYLATR
jgi:hypothetical protein